MNLVPEHEYHGVVIDFMPKTIFDWMETRFGKNSDRWFLKSSFGSTTVYFKDQRDHTLFLLTWGHSE